MDKHRFSGIKKLVDTSSYDQISRSHILVVGLGGVGSWTAEALVRSGVGNITLVDPDSVCVTNINRQLIALNSTVGQSKVSVMINLSSFTSVVLFLPVALLMILINQ